jgi:hypothetical protein
MSNDASSNVYIEINVDDLKELKRLYEKHKGSTNDVFEFKGRQIFTGYAKYLIEYLELQLKG